MTKSLVALAARIGIIRRSSWLSRTGRDLSLLWYASPFDSKNTRAVVARGRADFDRATMTLKTSTTQIAIGLASLTVSTLFTAMVIGVIPDHRSETLMARMRLTESIAVHFSATSDKVDANTTGQVLADLITRNPDLQSVGIRQPDGKYLVEAGEHAGYWAEGVPEDNLNTQIQFPLYTGPQLWGTIEARFVPINRPWFAGYGPSRKTQAIVFVGIVCTLLFHQFLRKVLKQLNPTQAVPRRVHEALDALAEGLLILDEQQRIVLTNSAFTTAIGRTGQALIGQTINIFSWTLKAGTVVPWDRALLQGETVTGVLMRCSETADRTFSVSAVPILDEHGTTRGTMVSFEDVTELERNKAELVGMLEQLRESRDEIQQQNRQLERLATTDPLTGCLNRRAFFMRFEAQWKLAEKHQRPLACILVDIDHFKQINDNHGHSTGDEVLRSIGQLLSTSVSEIEAACRYGGEEFCVLLPGADITEAARRAEQLRVTIERMPFEKLSITASFGVSCTSQKAAAPQLMLDQADASLYAAKRNGRNQVVCFDRMPTEITERARSDRRKTFTPEGKNTVDKLDVIPFEAVSALLSALSFRDVATAEHSHRVADLCVKVGEKLLSKAECYRLEVAALLHDIGKVGVPDAILRKSGELNADEWQLMDQHEQMGVEIVRKAFASQQLAEIIQNYRAWFNGCSRNPALPAGNAIPMEARILAIADAWDSMTTSRPWRPGRTFESAAVELKRCAGSQFDTECVEHFLRILRETSASQPATEMSADARSINEDLAEITTSLEAQNFERIATITDHLRSAANRLGAKNVTAQADRLRSAVMSDADLLSILHITRELTTECRQLQQSAPTAKRPTAE